MKLRVKSKKDQMAKRCVQSGQKLKLEDFNEIDRKILLMFYPDNLSDDTDDDVTLEPGIKQESSSDPNKISEQEMDNVWYLLPESDTVEENGFRITRVVSEYGDKIISEEAQLVYPTALIDPDIGGQPEETVQETVP